MVQDQEFLEYVVKAIVNNPDEVKTSRTVDERGVLITLDLNPTDMGYVIGRRGQTARAVRTLLKVVGAKNNARVNLKINEPEGGRGFGGGMRSGMDSGMGSGMGSGMNSGMGSSSLASNSSDDDIDTSSIDNLNI